MNDFKRKPTSLSDIVTSGSENVEEKIDSGVDKIDLWTNMDDLLKYFIQESENPETKLYALIREADILNGIVDDPLKLKPSDVKTILSSECVKNANQTNIEAMKKVEDYVEVELIRSYVEHRDKKNSDGTLDRMLSIQEMHVINNEKSRILNAFRELNPGLDSGRVAASVETFGEMNTDVRYRYESLKEIFCNDFGITPDSYDQYMKAITAENSAKVLTEGIDKKSDLYNTAGFQEKHKHLLKKVPGWKKGDVVYVSEFRKTVDEFEAERLKNSSGRNNEKSLSLFEGMKNMYRTIDNPLKSTNVNPSIGTDESRRNYLERRKLRIKHKKDEETKEVKPEEVKFEKVEKIEEFKESPSSLQYADALNDIVNRIETKNEDLEMVSEVKDEKSQVDTEYVNELMRYANVIDDEIEVKKEEPEIEPAVIVDEDVSVHPKTIDPKYSEKDYFSNRYDNEGTLDERAKVVKYDADPSVLRTSNPIDRLRLYKESKREGRLLYLINSGYEVFVKKIKIAEKITYMLSLIQESRTTDINVVDSAIKIEILRVIYDSIEFPDFDERPSFNEFIKNLSEYDMMTLVTMLALVNITEDKDGRVPLEVTNVICENCGQIAYFKEPITIDLKEEFKHMYPVNVYMNEHAKYKMANHPTILDAYRHTEFGRMTVIEHVEDDIKYQMITSMPTVWKVQQIKSHSSDMIYNSLRKELQDKFSSIQAMDRTNDMSTLKEYLENHSFSDYKKDVGRIIDMSVDEMSSPDNRTLSELLTSIEDRLEEISNFESVFMYIMEYIDVINITTTDGVSIVKGLTLDNPNEVLGVLKNLPLDLISKLTELKVVNGNSAVPIDITYTADELAGKLSFDEYYGSDEEAKENKRKQLVNLKYSEEEVEELTTKFLEARDIARKGLETESRCIQCKKCFDYKVNYTGILFFWTSKVSR